MKWSAQHRREERHHAVPQRAGRSRAGADEAHALQGRRSEAPAEGGVPVLAARVADPVCGDPLRARDRRNCDGALQVAGREAKMLLSNDSSPRNDDMLAT